MITHHHNPCQETQAITATGIPHLLPAKPFADQQHGVALRGEGLGNLLPGSGRLLEVHQISLHFSPSRPFSHSRKHLHY